MPGVGAGVSIDGHDRCQEEIVALVRAARAAAPFEAVADSEIQQIEIGIVRNGVPHRAAATVFPPLSRPGLRGPSHRVVLKRLRWISGYGVEAPGQLAGFGVVSGNVPSYSVFSAAVADHSPKTL